MTIRTFRQKWSYEILLCSFLLFIFGNTFSPENRLIGSIMVSINMLTGLVIFQSHKRCWTFILALNIAHLLLVTILKPYEYIGSFAVKHSIYQLYFWTVAMLVFKKIFTVKRVSKEMIAAVVCGFIILCLMGAFLFLQIELFHAHSFSHLPGGHKDIDELTYFSFETMLTTGYGDIAPLTLVAKHAVMIMGLVGHFYTVIVTSIIIGKYLSATRRREELSLLVEHTVNIEEVPAATN